MERLSKDTLRNIRQNCRVCGSEYETVYYSLLGCREIDSSHGLCPLHQAEYQAEYDHKKETNRTAAINTHRAKWKTDSGIPEIFVEATFDTFDRKVSKDILKAFGRAKIYSEDYPVLYRQYLIQTKRAFPSLLLFSTLENAGVGKSHLSCCIANRIYDRWQGEGMEPTDYAQIDDCLPIKWYCHMKNPIRYISEYEIYERIDAMWSYGAAEREMLPSEKNIMDWLKEVDLLIVDDLGKNPRKNSDFIQRTLFAIIDGRWKALKPMIISTNLTDSELKRHVRAPAFDRLWQMTSGEFVTLEGDSYRRKIQGNDIS
jgi:DNA replication protein DnaC